MKPETKEFLAMVDQVRCEEPIRWREVAADRLGVIQSFVRRVASGDFEVSPRTLEASRRHFEGRVGT